MKISWKFLVGNRYLSVSVQEKVNACLSIVAFKYDSIFFWMTFKWFIFFDKNWNNNTISYLVAIEVYNPNIESIKELNGFINDVNCYLESAEMNTLTHTNIHKNSGEDSEHTCQYMSARS